MCLFEIKKKIFLTGAKHRIFLKKKKRFKMIHFFLDKKRKHGGDINSKFKKIFDILEVIFVKFL